MKSEHQELVAEVDTLKKKVAARDQELEKTLVQAETQMVELQGKLDEANELLRSNQASLGIRVENLELDQQELRGLSEDSQNEVAALSQNLGEARGELDERIKKLEEATNQANSVPEGKQALFAAAESALKRNDYRQARQMYRIFISRYPEDKKAAEARFKIGQSLFNERDYRSALGEFYWIVQNRPNSEMIHDALYYSGLAFAKLGQCDKAIAYFEALARKDSGTPKRYVQQASKQIDTLKKDQGKICSDKAKNEEGRSKAADKDKRKNPVPGQSRRKPTRS